MAKKKKFDPMGSGYDYETAKKEGVKPVMGDDGKPHWGSRAPKSGKILKGRSHKTFRKAQSGEELMGYDMKFEKGRYRSQKRDEVKIPKGGRVEIK